jgi:hypothetical protein
MINYKGSGYFSQCMYIMQVDKNEHTRVVLDLSTHHDQAVKSKHILYTVQCTYYQGLVGLKLKREDLVKLPYLFTFSLHTVHFFISWTLNY